MWRRRWREFRSEARGERRDETRRILRLDGFFSFSVVRGEDEDEDEDRAEVATVELNAELVFDFFVPAEKEDEEEEEEEESVVLVLVSRSAVNRESRWSRFSRSNLLPFGFSSFGFFSSDLSKHRREKTKFEMEEKSRPTWIRKVFLFVLRFLRILFVWSVDVLGRCLVFRFLRF